MAFQTMSGIPKVTSTANFYSNTNPLLQSRGIGGFTQPSALFGNGEQGAWWDFSDLTVMFQDSAGTVPAVLESPVGKVLDKSGKNNHLIQATAGARPVLSRRYNLLSNTAFIGGTSGVIGVDAVAPTNWIFINVAGTVVYKLSNSGNGSAIKFIANGNRPAIGLTLNVLANTTYSMFVVVEALDSGSVQISELLTIGGAPAGATQTFNINGVTVPGTTQVSVNSVIGTEFVVGATAGTAQFRLGPGAAGAPTVDITLSRPDLRLKADTLLAMPQYQRVNTATDYDTLGFPAYLLFDGATKWMQSAASVDLSGTSQATMITGLTKLAELTTNAFVAEHGIGGVDLKAASLLYAPRSASANSYGTQIRDAVPNVPGIWVAPYAPPNNSVVSTKLDYAGAAVLDQVKVYVNNSQPAQNTEGAPATLTTFGNFPLYVGCRGAGASLFFSGRLFGMILRGAATNDNDFQMTNKWMGSKCGLFF